MDILDEMPQYKDEAFVALKKQKKVLGYSLMGMWVIYGITYGLLNKTAGVGFTVGVTLGIVAWCLLSGLVLGCILALLPFKNLSYREKFQRAFLIAALIASIVIFFSLIAGGNRY